MLLEAEVNKRKKQSLPFRGALLSSGVMAFAGLGDAFLYPVLPIYGKEMGFSVFFIGLSLSVNRFIRIIANTYIANLVRKVGMKSVLIACSILSVQTTIFYGIKVGLILFLIARILWGLSYSGLKIATLNYAALVEKKSGLAFGFAQSIKSLGGLFILWLGPIIVAYFGIQNGLFMIALISSLGIFLALLLPTPCVNEERAKVQTKKTFAFTSINLMIFLLSLVIDGILVVGLAHLFGSSSTNLSQLLTTVAFYLLLKRFFAFGISLLSGFLTLKISLYRLFLVSVFICIVSLILIALHLTFIGVTLAFLFNTIVVTFSPLIAINQQGSNKNSLQAISGISTWWDLGAAVGALIGIFLMEAFGSQQLFLSFSIIILVLFINFIKQYGNTSSRAL